MKNLQVLFSIQKRLADFTFPGMLYVTFHKDNHLHKIWGFILSDNHPQSCQLL